MDVNTSQCSDFSLQLRIGTSFDLPTSRETDTVIHYADQLRKSHPRLVDIDWNEDENVLGLEEEHAEEGPYRWLRIEKRKLLGGFHDPVDFDEAVRWNSRIAAELPDLLSLSPLGIEYLEAAFVFLLDYNGNHDEIVAKALYADSPWTALLQEEGTQAVDFETGITVCISEDRLLRATVNVITPGVTFKQRVKGEFPDNPIQVRFILRRLWRDRPSKSMNTIYEEMVRRGVDLCNRIIVPHFVEPIKTTIMLEGGK